MRPRLRFPELGLYPADYDRTDSSKALALLCGAAGLSLIFNSTKRYLFNHLIISKIKVLLCTLSYLTCHIFKTESGAQEEVLAQNNTPLRGTGNHPAQQDTSPRDTKQAMV